MGLLATQAVRAASCHWLSSPEMVARTAPRVRRGPVGERTGGRKRVCYRSVVRRMVKALLPLALAGSLVVAGCSGVDDERTASVGAPAEATIPRSSSAPVGRSTSENDREFLERCLVELAPRLFEHLRVDGMFNRMFVSSPDANEFDVSDRDEVASSELVQYLRPRLNYLGWSEFRSAVDEVLSVALGVRTSDLRTLNSLDSQAAADDALRRVDESAIEMSRLLANPQSADADVLAAYRVFAENLMTWVGGPTADFFNQVYNLLIYSGSRLSEMGPFVDNSPDQVERLLRLVEPVTLEILTEVEELYSDFIGDALSRAGASMTNFYLDRMSSTIARSLSSRAALRSRGIEPPFTFELSSLNDALRTAATDPEQVAGYFDTRWPGWDELELSWAVRDPGGEGDDLLSFWELSDPSAPWNKYVSTCERL